MDHPDGVVYNRVSYLNNHIFNPVSHMSPNISSIMKHFLIDHVWKEVEAFMVVIGHITNICPNTSMI